MKMRIVFMGTPEFAGNILKKITEWEGGEVVGVYTQPDRAAGRGKKIGKSAVKDLAEALGLKIFQPVHFKAGTEEGEAARAQLKALQADVFVVAAYGLILPQAVLDMARLGAYNVHGSLLPKYRGAAPVQRALMDDLKITGVTVMRMEAGLDTGPVLLQQAVDVGLNDTSESMLCLLADMGGDLMLGALGMVAENRAVAVKQNDAMASHAAKLAPEDGMVNWSQGAEQIHACLRGVWPWPGGQTELCVPGHEGLNLRLEPGRLVKREVWEKAGAKKGMPGEVLGMAKDNTHDTMQDMLLVACGPGMKREGFVEGVYGLVMVKPAGKSRQSVRDLANGYLRGAQTACCQRPR